MTPARTVQTSGQPLTQGAGPASTAPAIGPEATLAELIDAYMRAYAARDRTRAGILVRWSQMLGDRPAFEVSDDDIFRGLEQLANEPARVYYGRDADGRRILRAKPGLRSASTVNRYHAAIAAVFTWSIKRRIAPRGWENPARKVERAPESAGRVRFLSEDERERLLEACRESSWARLYLLVLMAITTGARRGELLGLTWADIDIEHGVAHVRDSKNGQPRALPLTEGVKHELMRFATDQTPERSAVVRIFPSRGAPTRPRAFESAWQAALERARIKKFRFHDLRHTCASYLAQNGASLLEIADVMGHRQLAMVRRYAHLTTDTKAKLVNRVLGGIR